MTPRQPPRPPRRGAQLGLDLAPRTWGGKRAGAGRKPGPRATVPRRKRATLDPDHPVHVTLRILDGAPTLRRAPAYRALRAVMRTTGHRAHFRICHYSIAGNHVHLICEAAGADGLARGVQGFSSLAARRLNQHWARTGKLFADRYHARALSTPSVVRRALVYVLNNWRHHDADHRDWRTDPFSSGALFEGWTEQDEARPAWLDPGEPLPVAEPHTWLLRSGWRRAGGPISPYEVPGSPKRGRS